MTRSVFEKALLGCAMLTTVTLGVVTPKSFVAAPDCAASTVPIDHS
jgi:hypothetical protein